jgi:hypothetical protein
MNLSSFKINELTLNPVDTVCGVLRLSTPLSTPVRVDSGAFRIETTRRSDVLFAVMVNSGEGTKTPVIIDPAGVAAAAIRATGQR